MKPESARHAAEALRANDRDRYFATLVLPPEARDAVTALYAFNAEIASIRDRVAREPAAGEIRLQWWMDALTGEGHGAVRQNPLADALLDAVAAYGLPVPALTRLLTARRFDLYHDPMPDIPTFEGYAGDTHSALYQLAAMILNGGRPIDNGDAAGHLGVAHALIGHLRAFGYNASQGRIYLPWSVFAAHGIAENDVLSGKDAPGLPGALAQLAELAADHLDKAEAAIPLLHRPLRAGMAPVALLRAEHRALDFTTPFAPPASIPDWRKIAALAWWKLRNA